MTARPILTLASSPLAPAHSTVCKSASKLDRTGQGSIPFRLCGLCGRRRVGGSVKSGKPTQAARSARRLGPHSAMDRRFGSANPRKRGVRCRCGRRRCRLSPEDRADRRSGHGRGSRQGSNARPRFAVYEVLTGQRVSLGGILEFGWRVTRWIPSSAWPNAVIMRVRSGRWSLCPLDPASALGQRGNRLRWQHRPRGPHRELR
jgi:hypothetical protein